MDLQTLLPMHGLCTMFTLCVAKPLFRPKTRRQYSPLWLRNLLVMTPRWEFKAMSLQTLLQKSLHHGKSPFGQMLLLHDRTARRKPSGSPVPHTFGTPYVPPHAMGRTGYSRPLELAGHTPAVDTAFEVFGQDFPLPYTSFDERLGERVLSGNVQWQSQHFVNHALTTANLPGTPIGRVMGYEIVSCPGPQVALTQDRGRDFRRAVVIDFRAQDGSLATVDLAPGTTPLGAIAQSPPFDLKPTLIARLEAGRTACYINGLVADIYRAVSPDADAIQFLNLAPSQAPPLSLGPGRTHTLALPHVLQDRSRRSLSDVTASRRMRGTQQLRRPAMRRRPALRLRQLCPLPAPPAPMSAREMNRAMLLLDLVFRDGGPSPGGPESRATVLLQHHRATYSRRKLLPVTTRPSLNALWWFSTPFIILGP